MSAVDFIRESITEQMFVEVIKNHGSRNFRKLGDVYRGTCPIHNGDNDTAFIFDPNKMLFNCFTECGGGDCFDFVAMIYDVDIEKEFIKVINLTANEFGIDIDGLELKDISHSYKHETIEYLRYLSGKDQIYNLPYDLSHLGSKYPINSYRGIEKDILERLGVYYYKDLERVGFTIYDTEGNIIGSSLRTIKDEKPKWIHRPKSIKTGRIFYNLKNVVDKGFREVIVVEGIMDCLNLVRQGIENVICAFGARVTDEQKMILIMYFDTVVLAFDNDKAGILATNKAIQKLNKIIIVKVLMYDKKDPGMLDLSVDLIDFINWYDYNLE